MSNTNKKKKRVYSGRHHQSVITDDSCCECKKSIDVYHRPGIKKVCAKYGVEYEKAPYADSNFFNDIHNVFRFTSKHKSKRDYIVALVNDAANELKVHTSYEKIMSVINDLNKELDGLIKYEYHETESVPVQKQKRGRRQQKKNV